MTGFLEFLRLRLESGGFTTEDALTSMLPLVRLTASAHAGGLVAPLEGLESLQVDGVRIVFDQARNAPPKLRTGQVQALEKTAIRAFDVVGESRYALEVAAGRSAFDNLRIGQRGAPVKEPVYLPGYVSWEHEIGHHDPLCDIFCLGLILASLTCGLDLTDSAALRRFVERRSSLFEINPDIHPVLAKLVVRMTELERRKRPQDLAAVLGALENYRDQNIDFEFEVTRTTGFRQADLSSKRRAVLATLQRRLFELNKRNRLLHFRSTMQTANLTIGSVPLSFDVHSLRPEQILTWNDQLHERVVAQKSLSLNSCLRFEEAIYLPSLLDRIRLETQRDQAEFGFAQLRLVLCFLRWSNLKEKPPERFDSPLILLPVQLVKKKGVRDTFALEILSSEAEINPVLRYYFKQLYDIGLPEFLELSQTNLDAFHEFLAAKVQQSEPAASVVKISRPRIQLIHARAQRRLDQYVQRSRLSGRGIRMFQDIDYSYDPENFHPLGLRLFQTKVQHAPTNLQTILERTPRVRSFMVAQADEAKGDSGPDGVPPSVEAERTLYSMNEPEESNPYVWEYDLCNLTLGNFRYRRFSLVRDYAALLEKDCEHPVFDAVFALAPRAVEPAPPAIAREDRFEILTCDPTQGSALAHGRSGRSFIIQGPPGTGKSQTIANLIADYVALGKRVLFVCEKRAAIDVVYQRLHQNGLHLLCSLIHDSQEDKKAFIMDLKQTYETFLDSAAKKGPGAERQRTQLLQTFQQERKSLDSFFQTMNSAVGPNPGVGAPAPASTYDAASDVSLRDLVGRLVSLRSNIPGLGVSEKERLPDYQCWLTHHDRVERLAILLEDQRGDAVFAHHPLKYLSPRLVGAERPHEKVAAHLQSSENLIVRLETALQAIGLRPDECNTIESVKYLVGYAETMRGLAEKNQLPLLIPDSALSKRLDAFDKDRRKKDKALEAAKTLTKGWRQKLSAEEASDALEQAKTLEKSYLPFLRPAWWRLRHTLERCYDFAAHNLKPTWTQVLEKLVREQEIQQDLDAVEKQAHEAFQNQVPLTQFVEEIGRLRQAGAAMPAFIRDLQVRLLMKGEADQAILRVHDLKPDVEQLDGQISDFLENCNGRPFLELRKLFDQIEAALDDLPDFLACLAEAAGLPAELLAILRELDLSPVELEAAIAQEAWDRVCRADRSLQRFSERVRGRHARKLGKVVEDLYTANAAMICERVRARFLDHVRIANLPQAELTAQEKDFKASFNRGRRELEHEFGKVMRYRSIRELAAGDSGQVIKDLKPVWLMSPLSASDTLPLETTHFDVVIFDEASQVTLEGAVPALFRASQAIVVGDPMQLPPTNFFSSKHPEDAESLTAMHENGEAVENDLESDSFLVHAAKVLPSTMLGWHYRSRSESLISFSNAFFYQGRLLTVPDKALPAPAWKPITANSAEEGANNHLHLLDRPVSFHFLAKGVYETRRNTAEAEYIAHLVKALLSKESGPSIGIIAFSEAQQSEILDALRRLGEEDDRFSDRLEAEFEREEDGQFTGLLVKNLENIQGDERDIVILSVCYGPGPSGKMLMNFGPINQSGGEKRLNVAFSRAKQHMAVVSSIHHDAITNDYNEGARCLKSYLRYAAACSQGDAEQAERVLRETLVQTFPAGVDVEQKGDIVVDQLAAALRDKGYLVDLDVGQSSFRCNLAVRKPDQAEYCAGIVVDTVAYYDQTDSVEREVMRPRLLEAFGWRVKHVLAKDWLADAPAVLDGLQNFIEGKSRGSSLTPVEDEEAEPKK